VPLPTKEGIEEVFKIHTRKMAIDKKINMKKLFKELAGFSGAEIKAVCTEAGYFAIRKNRTKIKEKDLFDGIKKVKQKEEESKDYIKMFG